MLRLLGKRRQGVEALAVMEQHLGERLFFVADAYSIADVALCAYTHVAGEEGFGLAPFPTRRLETIPKGERNAACADSAHDARCSARVSRKHQCAVTCSSNEGLRLDLNDHPN